MIQTTLDMFRKTPEEIIKDRHTPGFVEPDVDLSEKKKNSMQSLLSSGSTSCRRMACHSVS
jgi:hypothetical protein